MSRMRLSLVLVLVILLLGTGLATFFVDSAKKVPQGPFVGRMAPDFVLFDLNGQSVRLSQHRGKYVFLNFWATWCPYCVEELPYLNDLHEEKTASGENIVFLTIDKEEPLSTVKSFIEDHGYSFPVLLDGKGAVSRKYYVTGIPQSFLIDPDGIVIQRYPGMLTEKQMRSVVEGVLK